ncbi:indigoidine synthase A family protein [Treponema primitia ZAS-2]|uniref:Pseudouridine-5'-phosphate glycosidase n=1 Tax=Treponema primitia (strain ATCC BAA-887 / DSM 12427 / ZAS-2) TaxID=545694 RepID=F5YQ89_TREPZ|nr:pseudouridine-5'-phosphate glycosidase [Treponema primitia]AEF85982.1 indigoidine synthase A family protein [Treponema primitia ZAS-2]
MKAVEKYLDIQGEVREALAKGQAVVALESTIISHGMPYPDNLECAAACERIVREHGAIPATIAILKGRVKIGLTSEDLSYLASAKSVFKCSRRDLGYVLARGLDGATTVAATMILAARAGIRFFATGGVGGVHRGAESTMDISADMTELQTTDVCVISAGVKSILDIGRTLEYLETLGVPVAAFSQNRFPAFYTPDSGFDAPLRLDSAEDAAKMMKIKWDFDLHGGAIIGNPIPKEYAVPPEKINAAIDSALKQAGERGIAGKALTPFLLDKIKELTGGESLEANKHLVYNNAALAADIASAFAALK